MTVISKTQEGVVLRITGEATRRAPDGTETPLQVGDEVRAGDEIITSPDGIVEISFFDAAELAPLIPPGEAPGAGPVANIPGSLRPGFRVDRITENLDLGGNLAAPAATGVVVDDFAETATAALPTLPFLTLDAPDRTADTTPTLTGSSNVQAGSQVTLTITDALGKQQTVTTVVQPDGRYSVDVPQPLPEGPYTVTGVVTAPGGQVVEASDAGSVLIPPVAADAQATTAEDTTLQGTLPVATDTPGDPITYAKGSEASHGTVTVNPDGSYSYVPTADYNGPDSFTYTVTDGQGNSNTYTVTITVTPVQDAPVAADARSRPDEDSTLQRHAAGGKGCGRRSDHLHQGQ